MTLYDSFQNAMPLGITPARAAAFSNTAPVAATFAINAAFSNDKALKLGEEQVMAPG